MNFDPYSMLKTIADRGIANQKVNPGDTYDADGCLTCGVCKRPRQKFIMVAAPTDAEPERKMRMKVTTQCDCEVAKENAEKRLKEDQDAMEKVMHLRKASLMDAKFKGATFDNFSVTKSNERNLKLCKRYATAFDTMLEKNQGLILWGNVGTGKSFAAACIANYLLDRGVPVIMTSLVKLLELIQGGEEKETDILARLNSAKLVIFDDLGAERNTDYALEKIYNIVDSRYRRQKPMIFTTNLAVAEMQEETDIRYSRIYDRVFEVCYPMQFIGQSWRMKTASRRFDEMEQLLNGE